MCFFKKKPTVDKVKEDHNLLLANEKELRFLAEIEREETLKAELERFVKEVAYIAPSSDANIQAQDKKIGNLIGDYKILAMKSSSEKEKKEEAARKLEMALAARKNAH